MADFFVDPADIVVPTNPLPETESTKQFKIDPVDLAEPPKFELDSKDLALPKSPTDAKLLTLDEIKAASKPKTKGFVESFVSGISPKADETHLQSVPFASGAESMGIAKNAYDAAKRLEQNPYNDADQRLVLDYIKSQNQMPENVLGKMGYGIGSILKLFPAYAGELALTAGVFTGARAGAEKVATEYLKKLPQKIVESTVANMAVRAGTGAVGALAQTPVASVFRIAEGTIHRMIPEVKFQEQQDGSIKAETKDGQQFMEALTRSFGQNYIENLSEHSGAWIGDAFGQTIGKIPLLKSLQRTAVMKWIAKRPEVDMGELEKGLRSGTAWHGILREIAEEEAAKLGHALTGEEKYSLTTPDEFATQVIGFAIPEFGFRMAGRAQQALAGKVTSEEAKKETKTEEKLSPLRAAQKILPEDKWHELLGNFMQLDKVGASRTLNDYPDLIDGIHKLIDTTSGGKVKAGSEAVPARPAEEAKPLAGAVITFRNKDNQIGSIQVTPGMNRDQVVDRLDMVGAVSGTINYNGPDQKENQIETQKINEILSPGEVRIAGQKKETPVELAVIYQDEQGRDVGRAFRLTSNIPGLGYKGKIVSEKMVADMGLEIPDKQATTIEYRPASPVQGPPMPSHNDFEKFVANQRRERETAQKKEERATALQSILSTEDKTAKMSPAEFAEYLSSTPGVWDDYSQSDLYELLTQRPVFRNKKFNWAELTKGLSAKDIKDWSAAIDKIYEDNLIKEKAAREEFNAKIKAGEKGFTSDAQNRHWTQWSINDGERSGETRPKLYVTLKIDQINKQSAEQVGVLLKRLSELGFNGKLKTSTKAAPAIWRFETVVIYGKTEADLAVAENEVPLVFGSAVESTAKGMDSADKSSNQIVAQQVHQRILDRTLPKKAAEVPAVQGETALTQPKAPEVPLEERQNNNRLRIARQLIESLGFDEAVKVTNEKVIRAESPEAANGHMLVLQAIKGLEASERRSESPVGPLIAAALKAENKTEVERLLQLLGDPDNRGKYTFSDAGNIAGLMEGNSELGAMLVRGEPVWKWVQRVKDSPNSRPAKPAGQPAAEEKPKEKPAPKPVDLNKAKSEISPESAKMVEEKVKSLGSLKANFEFYDDDHPVSVYGRALAMETYKGEAVPEIKPAEEAPVEPAEPDIPTEAVVAKPPKPNALRKTMGKGKRKDNVKNLQDQVVEALNQFKLLYKDDVRIASYEELAKSDNATRLRNGIEALVKANNAAVGKQKEAKEIVYRTPKNQEAFNHAVDKINEVVMKEEAQRKHWPDGVPPADSATRFYAHMLALQSTIERRMEALMAERPHDARLDTQTMKDAALRGIFLRGFKKWYAIYEEQTELGKRRLINESIPDGIPVWEKNLNMEVDAYFGSLIGDFIEKHEGTQSQVPEGAIEDIDAATDKTAAPVFASGDQLNQQAFVRMVEWKAILKAEKDGVIDPLHEHDIPVIKAILLDGKDPATIAEEGIATMDEVAEIATKIDEIFYDIQKHDADALVNSIIAARPDLKPEDARKLLGGGEPPMASIGTTKWLSDIPAQMKLWAGVAIRDKASALQAARAWKEVNPEGGELLELLLTEFNFPEKILQKWPMVFMPSLEISEQLGSEAQSPIVAQGKFEGQDGQFVIVPPDMSQQDAMAALTAYHGGPHSFDKFDITKIGTGEGAQVYGWGLYFAQNKEVGKAYADKLGSSRMPDMEVLRAYFKPGALIPSSTMGRRDLVIAFREDPQRNGVWDVTVREMEEDGNGGWKPAEGMRVRTHQTPPSAEKLKAAGFETGHLYQVSIDVENDELMDYDKPLSEQSKKVREALSGYKDYYTGKNIYWDIAYDNSNGKPKVHSVGASKKLLSLGIKGIKFLDQGSRKFVEDVSMYFQTEEEAKKYAESGERGGYRKIPNYYTNSDGWQAWTFPPQTYNYVLFSDKDIKITEKNGKKVEPSMGGPMFRVKDWTVDGAFSRAAGRIMVALDSTNPDSAVHELMHPVMMMLSTEERESVANEWERELNAAIASENNAVLKNFLESLKGNQLKSNEFIGLSIPGSDKYYHLINQDEYAVRQMVNLLKSRPTTVNQTIIQKLMQFMRDLIAKVLQKFNLTSRQKSVFTQVLEKMENDEFSSRPILGPLSEANEAMALLKPITKQGQLKKLTREGVDVTKETALPADEKQLINEAAFAQNNSSIGSLVEVFQKLPEKVQNELPSIKDRIETLLASAKSLGYENLIGARLKDVIQVTTPENRQNIIGQSVANNIDLELVKLAKLKSRAQEAQASILRLAEDLPKIEEAEVQKLTAREMAKQAKKDIIANLLRIRRDAYNRGVDDATITAASAYLKKIRGVREKELADVIVNLAKTVEPAVLAGASQADLTGMILAARPEGIADSIMPEVAYTLRSYGALMEQLEAVKFAGNKAIAKKAIAMTLDLAGRVKGTSIPEIMKFVNEFGEAKAKSLEASKIVDLFTLKLNKATEKLQTLTQAIEFLETHTKSEWFRDNVRTAANESEFEILSYEPGAEHFELKFTNPSDPNESVTVQTGSVSEARAIEDQKSWMKVVSWFSDAIESGEVDEYRKNNMRSVLKQIEDGVFGNPTYHSGKAGQLIINELDMYRKVVGFSGRLMTPEWLTKMLGGELGTLGMTLYNTYAQGISATATARNNHWPNVQLLCKKAAKSHDMTYEEWVDQISEKVFWSWRGNATKRYKQGSEIGFDYKRNKAITVGPEDWAAIEAQHKMFKAMSDGALKLDKKFSFAKYFKTKIEEEQLSKTIGGAAQRGMIDYSGITMPKSLNFKEAKFADDWIRRSEEAAASTDQAYKDRIRTIQIEMINGSFNHVINHIHDLLRDPNYKVATRFRREYLDVHGMIESGNRPENLEELVEFVRVAAEAHSTPNQNLTEEEIQTSILGEIERFMKNVSGHKRRIESQLDLNAADVRIVSDENFSNQPMGENTAPHSFYEFSAAWEHQMEKISRHSNETYAQKVINWLKLARKRMEDVINEADRLYPSLTESEKQKITRDKLAKGEQMMDYHNAKILKDTASHELEFFRAMISHANTYETDVTGPIQTFLSNTVGELLSTPPAVIRNIGGASAMTAAHADAAGMQSGGKTLFGLPIVPDGLARVSISFVHIISNMLRFMVGGAYVKTFGVDKDMLNEALKTIKDNPGLYDAALRQMYAAGELYYHSKEINVANYEPMLARLSSNWAFATLGGSAKKTKPGFVGKMGNVALAASAAWGNVPVLNFFKKIAQTAEFGVNSSAIEEANHWLAKIQDRVLHAYKIRADRGEEIDQNDWISPQEILWEQSGNLANYERLKWQFRQAGVFNLDKWLHDYVEAHYAAKMEGLNLDLKDWADPTVINAFELGMVDGINRGTAFNRPTAMKTGPVPRAISTLFGYGLWQNSKFSTFSSPAIGQVGSTTGWSVPGAAQRIKSAVKGSWYIPAALIVGSLFVSNGVKLSSLLIYGERKQLPDTFDPEKTWDENVKAMMVNAGSLNSLLYNSVLWVMDAGKPQPNGQIVSILPVAIWNSIYNTLAQMSRSGDIIKPGIEFVRQWAPNSRIILNRIDSQEGIINSRSVNRVLRAEAPSDIEIRNAGSPQGGGGIKVSKYSGAYAEIVNELARPSGPNIAEANRLTSELAARMEADGIKDAQEKVVMSVMGRNPINAVYGRRLTEEEYEKIKSRLSTKNYYGAVSDAERFDQVMGGFGAYAGSHAMELRTTERRPSGPSLAPARSSRRRTRLGRSPFRRTRRSRFGRRARL